LNMRLITLPLLFATSLIFGQSWVELKNDPTVNFYDVQSAFDQAWDGKEYEKGKGYKQFKRWEWFTEQRTYPSGDRTKINNAFKDYYLQAAQKSSLQQKQSGNWQELGPFSWQSTSYSPGLGRVNVVMEDPSNSNILYAGTPAGGLWKSTNGGNSWIPLTDDFSAIGISGIAIDHSNPNVIYVSTGDGDGSDTYSIGVMKSTDGGFNWSPTGMIHTISQSRTTSKLLMHPTDNQTLFVATNDGLWKTTDAGNNWSQVLSGRVRDMEFRPFDPNTVYACTDEFFVSTNGGNSFNQITNGLPSAGDVNRLSVAVSPDEPDWVYILAGSQADASFFGLFKSTNSGNSFTMTTNTPNLFGYSDDGSDGAGQSWYDMALAVNPNDANKVIVGGVNVWKSIDGGVNFTISSHWVYPATVGYTHADIHTLDYFNDRLYCGSDGGLFISTDFGVSYTDLSAGMQISQFYRLGGSVQNPDKIVAGAQDNGSFFYDGSTWTHVLGADGMEACFSPTNDDVIFVTWQNGPITRSTDGGASWQTGVVDPGQGNENGAWIVPYVAKPGNKVFVGMENIWLSTDNGDNFTQISNFSNGTVKDIAVFKGNHDYVAASFSGDLYLTQDGGTNWTLISAGLPGNYITDVQFHASDPDLIYVSLSGYDAGEKIYATRDAGATWINLSANLPNLPANTLILQEGTQGGVYVGTDVGVYYTDSTLSNWQSFMDGLPNVIVNELEIHYGSNKLRAATYGRGVWESDLFTPSALPPTADFVYTEDKMCQADSVKFSDASINAAPGWTWYFPGGSPTTSTLQSPSVLYPSAGSYDASLVVQNANGTDSISHNVTVDIGVLELFLEINTDDYPSETTWTIEDDQGNLIQSGGGYGVANDYYSHNICLDSGCYSFTIYDSYGDGICCGYGNGSYELFDNLGVSVADGGDFGGSEGTNFCVQEDNSAFIIETAKWMTLFPNPSQGVINVRLSEVTSTEIVVTDAIGQVVHQQVFAGEILDIDLSHASKGVYFITVKSSNAQQTSKFILE
jgi:PKD repeat protein